MAIFTWIGSNGTIDPNDAGQAANWSPAGVPGDNDTIIVGTGATLHAGSIGSTATSTGMTIQAAGTDTLTFINQNFVQASISVGNATTLNLTGSFANSAGFDIGATGNNQTQFHQSGVGSALTINTVGTVDSGAFFWLDSPNGSITFNVTQNGTARGNFYSSGPIINLGGTLTVNSDNTVLTGNNGNRFSNAGYMLLASVNGAAFAKLNARMGNTGGVIELAQFATAAVLEIATNMPGAQIVEFGAANNNTVVIDATTTLAAYANVGTVTTTVLQNSFERFNEFGPGNTIDLAGVSRTGLTYSYGNDPTWGNNVLTLVRNGTTIVARLRFTGSSVFADGSLSNFVLATDSAGTGTAITVSATPVSVFNPGTGLNGGTLYNIGGAAAVFLGPTATATLGWGTAGNWTGGTSAGLPGQYQAVVITNSLAQLNSFARYELDVSSAQTAGGLALDDHFVTLKIGAALTLAATPGQSSGGGLTHTAGTLDIAAGGILTATNITSLSRITLEAGASLAISGIAPFVLGSGKAGLAIDSSTDISGATVTSGGAIIIGSHASAQVRAVTTNGTASSVTATYTALGAAAVDDPNQFNGVSTSSLTISGVNTVWRDVGGDATTPFSGAMLVGGGGTTANALGVTSAISGNGSLNVDQSATLIDSAYAILGLFSGSNGAVTVQNGAKWLVNTDSLNLPGSIIVGSATISSASPPPLLSVGYLGTGSLNVASGATITLGSEPAASGQYGLVIGNGGGTLSQATHPGGTVTVNAALLDSNLASIAIGQRGDGVLSISNGGTVRAGNGGGVGFSVVVGSRNYVLAGTTTASTGTLTIGGGTGTSALISSSDFIDGRDGIGSVTIGAGGRLAVTGRFYEGGSGAGRGAATNTGSNFLVQGGSVSVDLSLIIGTSATIFGGSNFDLEAGAVEIANNGTLVTGNIIVGSAGTLTMQGNGAGSKTVLTDNASGGSLVDNGLIQAMNGTLEVAANVGGTGRFLATGAGVMQFNRVVNNTVTVSLGGTLSTGTLELAAPISFHGTIDNFWDAASGPRNSVYLDGIGSFLPGLVWTQIDGAHGSLAVSINGTTAATLTIAGFHPGGFSFAGNPGTIGGPSGLIVYAVDTAPSAPPSVSAPIFVSETNFGTLIVGKNISQVAPSGFQVTTVPNAVVALLDGGAALVGGSADGSGNFTGGVAGMSLGTHTLTATASSGGVTSLPSAPTNFVLASASQTSFQVGSGSAKLLLGGGDNTVSFGNTGTVQITAGNGFNNIYGGDSASTVSLGSGGSVVYLGNGIDNVMAIGAGNNQIVAGNGNDTAITGVGNDNIYLGNGNNTVYAGDGRNHVIVGGGTNNVTTGVGNDEIEAGNGPNTINAGNGANYVQAGNGANFVITGTGADGIQLGDGSNVVNAGAGDDVLVIGNGNNTIDLGSGVDFVRVGGGNNGITGSTGNKTVDLHGGGTNTVTLGLGAELIYGSGNNTISFGDGSSVVSMLDGHDVITGGNGNNSLLLTNIASTGTVTLGNGANTVVTGIGGATISLGSGNNYVEVAGGANAITVGNGSNVVKGAAGNDVFTIGNGFVHGNGGNDIFNLGAGTGAAYGDWGSNLFNLSTGAWFIAPSTGPDTIHMASAAGFADVAVFDPTKDVLTVSDVGFGLGIAGITGNVTQAMGTLLSTTLDGNFSSSSALFSFNQSNGSLWFRPDAATGSHAIAVFENHPIGVGSTLLIGA